MFPHSSLSTLVTLEASFPPLIAKAAVSRPVRALSSRPRHVFTQTDYRLNCTRGACTYDIHTVGGRRVYHNLTKGREVVWIWHWKEVQNPEKYSRRLMHMPQTALQDILLLKTMASCRTYHFWLRLHPPWPCPSALQFAS